MNDQTVTEEVNGLLNAVCTYIVGEVVKRMQPQVAETLTEVRAIIVKVDEMRGMIDEWKKNPQLMSEDDFQAAFAKYIKGGNIDEMITERIDDLISDAEVEVSVDRVDVTLNK